ncbi:MAG: hypothetical protein IJB17_03005 [Oscillospiraceae bacterium]|nr:hypothetical protein [Oscillospiraceae bacterium]
MGKRKKEKITYIDDGRSLSELGSGQRLSQPTTQPRASLKEQWNTYWGAVKMMFGPMLVFIVGLCIVYMIAAFIFSVI